jgi:hypothetical protein
MNFFILLWKLFLLTQYMYLYKKYCYKNNKNISYNLITIGLLFVLYSCFDVIFLLKLFVLTGFILIQEMDGLQIFKQINNIIESKRNKIIDVVVNGIDKIIESQCYLFEFYDKFYFLLYNDTLNAFIMKKNDENKLIEMNAMLTDIKSKINNLNTEFDEHEKNMEDVKVLDKLPGEFEELDFNELIKMMSENIKKTMVEINNNNDLNGEMNEETNLLDLNKILDFANNNNNLNFDVVKELLNKEEEEDDISEFLVK